MKPKPVLALGLMSGTSADGVSLALVEVSGERLSVIAHADVPYSKRMRDRILSAPGLGAEDLASLNFELGRLFAEEAKRFLWREGAAPGACSVVGSHGQTVVHRPEGRAPFTLQIGEPSFLAEALRVPVVSDFRPRDMAAGGQGAPLVPILDRFLFGGGPPRALQNIGGIGNVTLVGKGVALSAFDTGPGNCLIDIAARRATAGRLQFDEGGRLGAKGSADAAKARALLAMPYFSKRPPKSLDRHTFGESYFRTHFGRMKPNDAVATATSFTALSIAESYRRWLPKKRLKEVVVSGGGVFNPTLMRVLAKELGTLPVRSIADFGVPPLAKEPALMALMAWLALTGRPNHVPTATGASGARILGKISPP